VSGYFSGSPDFDPESGVHVVNSKGSLDGFVLKLSQCPFPATQTISVIACNAYELNGEVLYR
jgi:hypothetical protein